LLSPNDWRKRVRGARRVAEILHNPTARAHMIACANAYELPVSLGERRVPDVKPCANDA
jgi:hypothetical protein